MYLPANAFDHYEKCKIKFKYLGYEEYKVTFRILSSKIAYSSEKKISDEDYIDCKNPKYKFSTRYEELSCNGKPVFAIDIPGNHVDSKKDYYIFDDYGNRWYARYGYRKRFFSPRCTQESKKTFSSETKTNLRVYSPEAKKFFFLKEHKIQYFTHNYSESEWQRPDL